MTAAAESTLSPQKAWWLRTLAVVSTPRAVFAALRDDSPEDVEARQEPVLAIVILAGIAGVLSTSLAGHVLDDPAVGNSTFTVLMWAFIGGLVYGALAYWIGGLIVYALASGIAARLSYRQSRHLLAFAAVPVALTLLLVWPVRIGIYGNDLFRSGGSDTGAGNVFFEGLVVAGYAWTFGLVALGLLELKRSSSSSAIS